MKEVFILRHGETEWNVAKRMQGRLDSPLTQNGKNQADKNGRLLKKIGDTDCLCVSPSGRTLETAYIVNSYAKAELVTFDELMERDMGDWSGLTVADIETHFPQAWASRETDPHGFRPPNGENLPDMLHRVKPVLEEIFDSEYERLVIVTHGIMSKVILAHFLSLEPGETNDLRHPNNLVYRLTFHANAIETHHFLDGTEAREGLYRLQKNADVRPISK
ncbi:MAG: hypothetical protein GKR90_22165 [Pseudomonadales bacterium]|nr:hypothetical protein [Pseudomonadales bacterium]